MNNAHIEVRGIFTKIRWSLRFYGYTFMENLLIPKTGGINMSCQLHIIIIKIIIISCSIVIIIIVIIIKKLWVTLNIMHLLRGKNITNLAQQW